MKQALFLALLLFVAMPCFAQWQDTKFSGYNTEVSAIGVHDTDLFVASSMMVNNTRNHLVYQYYPANPINPWLKMESGLDGSQGIVTSFAFLGRYTFAGMTHTSTGEIGPLYRSSNNGASWTYLQAGGPAATNGAYLFANGFNTGYRSADSGNTWQTLSNVEANMYYGDGSLVLATSSNSLYRSTDTGNHWSQLASAPFGGDIQRMGNALVMAAKGKLAISSDSGSGWTQLTVDSAGTPVSVNCVASYGSHLFAGTSKGVFVSNDTGNTWSAKNEAILYRDVFPVNMNLYPIIKQLAVYDTFLLAEAQYGGEIGGTYYLWKRPISELISDSQHMAVQELPTRFATLSVYPNPLANSASISYAVPERTPVAIEILNILGESVATVINQEQDAGTYLVSLNSQQLPSGIYWCQLRTAHSTLLQKLAIQK